MKSLTWLTTCLTLAFSLTPSIASAQLLDDVDDLTAGLGDIGSMYLGSITLQSVRRSVYEEPLEPDTSEVRSAYGTIIDLAALPLRTNFGGAMGLEAQVGLSYPFVRKFYGGMQMKFGMILEPFPLGPLSLRVAAGGGFEGHKHLYINPRATFALRWFAIEAAYKLIPARFSRPYKAGVLPGERGIREERIRGTLWLNVIPLDDADLGFAGIHIFGERITLESDNPEFLTESQIIAGTYWNGGVGFSF